MKKEVMLYYFSPTGGTKKVGESFCAGLAEKTQAINLGMKDYDIPSVTGDLVVVAAPVFAGRIPAIVIEKIKSLDGRGKRVVTIAVYGTRAYDDALLELNHTVSECGFEIIASAALIAQHSMVPIVGSGRPDANDVKEIQEFAEKVLEKIESGKTGNVEVPGKYPYKDHMVVSATPICMEACNHCGICEGLCPTGAIRITENETVTELEKCILCMACVAHCPGKARVLPAPMQEGLNQKLGVFKEIRRENEYFL